MSKFSHIQRMVSSGKMNTVTGIPTEIAMKVAGSIDKETFLAELADKWYDKVKLSTSFEEELAEAKKRIDKSSFKPVFDRVGITDQDLVAVLTKIRKFKEEHPTVAAKQQPARNSLCPCGSGKKYKKCCGAK